MSAGRVERWGPWLAALSVSLAFILFILAGIYTVHHQDHVNKQLCMQTLDNRKATRTTWDAARNLILRNQKDPKQIAATNKFFDAILETIPPLECIDNKPVVKEAR